MKPRELIFDGSVAYVPLTRGHYATIDAEDSPLVEGYNWCSVPGKTGVIYASRKFRDKKGNRKLIYIHRIIAKAKARDQVDHQDHDGLNNKKSNLRICSNKENSRNQRKLKRGSSQLKGVCWHKQKKRWYARIKLNGKQVWLGLHNTEEEAHKAYCEASEQMHKEYGCTVSYNQKNFVT